MCFQQKQQVAATTLPVAAPIVAPAPTRPKVTAKATKTPGSALRSNVAILKKRQGMFGNVRTTPMGDANYGAFAQFGSGVRVTS